MKDSTARQDLKELAQRVSQLETKLAALQNAYDDTFDFLATDLGYEALTTWNTDFYGFLGSGQRKVSPRQIARTVPAPQVIRKKTRRCK